MKTVQEIAQCAWEALRMFRTHAANEGAKEHWPWLTDDERAAFTASVQRVIDDDATTPERAHEDWCEHKRRAGYAHGPTSDYRYTLEADGPHMVKVPRQPTHAALLPWGSLTETQRAATRIFHATIQGLRESRGKVDLTKGTNQ